MKLGNQRIGLLIFLFAIISQDIMSQQNKVFDKKIEIGLSSGYHYWLSKEHKDIIKPVYYVGVTGTYSFKPKLKIGSNLQYGRNGIFKEQFYFSPFVDFQIGESKNSRLFLNTGIGIERSFGYSMIEFTYIETTPDNIIRIYSNGFNTKLLNNSFLIGLGNNIKLNRRIKLRLNANYVLSQNWIDEKNVSFYVEYRYKTGKSFYHGLRFEGSILLEL